MRRVCLLSIILFLPLLADAAAPPVKKGDLYLVAIGQEDGWKFLPESFERIFRDQGKGLYGQMHSRVLVGPRATRKELLADLEWVAGKAKKGDQVMLFIACHGICTREGESVFVTRDGKVRPRDIKAILAKLPCHALVVNDACCSGNWPRDLEGDPMPANVTALCCCLSTQVSGIEFDIALFEALYGKADFNKDGIVDLDEVIKYCGLRIKEVQGGRLTPVMHRAKNLVGSPPLTRVAPNLVSVAAQGELFAGLLEKQDGDNYQVRVIGFNDRPGPFAMKNKFTRAEVILPRDGAPLMVQKDGRWRQACLVGRQKEDYKVRFLGPTAEGKVEEAVVSGKQVRHLFAGNPGESFSVGMFRMR